MKKNPIAPWLYLLLPLVYFGVFFAYPMLRSFLLSVNEYNFIAAPKFVGLKNYAKLFTDVDFLRVLGTTISLSIFVIIANIFLPILLAVLINRQLRFIAFFRASYYIPVITSMVVIGIIWQGLYAELGLVNYLLQIFIQEPFNWLANPKTAIWAIGIVIIWRGLGYYMLIYLAGLQNIPGELYEASNIDGASKVQQFSRITIPLLGPSILIVSIMTSINAFKIFEEVYIMTGGGPVGRTETLVFFIFSEAFDKLQVGYANAAGVVLFAITLLFSIANIKIAKRREVY